MPKTLKLPVHEADTAPPPPPQAASGLIQVSPEQLAEMIAKAVADATAKPAYPRDDTMDLPTGSIPSELIADKSALPPPGERSASMVQAPSKIHGSFAINGIPVLAPGVTNSRPTPSGVVDPRTGSPFSQVMPPQSGGSISPPPSRHFK